MKKFLLFFSILLVTLSAEAKTKKVAPPTPKDDCGVNHDEICRVPAENPAAAPADPISAVLPKVEQSTPTPTPTPAPNKKKK